MMEEYLIFIAFIIGSFLLYKLFVGVKGTTKVLIRIKNGENLEKILLDRDTDVDEILSVLERPDSFVVANRKTNEKIILSNRFLTGSIITIKNVKKL